jgi:hypothetical protein
MKVFLSWSGELSHKVALALRDWLPSVLQFVAPYVSSEDIDKGARWSTDIAKELEASAYGVLCVTKSNLDAPWLTFEAGALSKALEKSRVSPILFGVKRSEIQGPILQFQSTVIEKDDLFKLVSSINRTGGKEEQLDEERLKKVFEVWWPELNSQFELLSKHSDSAAGHKTKPPVAPPDHAILEELLDLVRTQHKLLNNPEQILPPRYFEHLFNRINRRGDLSGRVTYDLRDAFEFWSTKYSVLEGVLEEVLKKSRPALNKEEVEHVQMLVLSIADVTRHIKQVLRDMRD